ncbi:hypothetical protein [Sphingopyxis sp.]|uniref:hypothetical protein n=1 Tax=Sphingopyxis sp. TaxID=1908224 RepID=UPI004037C465
MEDPDSITEILRLPPFIQMNEHILTPHEKHPAGIARNRHQFGRNRPRRHRAALDLIVFGPDRRVREHGRHEYRNWNAHYTPPTPQHNVVNSSRCKKRPEVAAKSGVEADRQAFVE